MSKSKKQRDLIEHRIGSTSISCTSMVVTVFGDMVSQHGGWISLSSLIKALEPYGFNERLVRTAVYREVQADWLKSTKVGRKSFYCFTDTARGHYEKAARRIYANTQPPWSGTWTLVIASNVPEDKKEVLRKGLLWQGFNTLVSGMYAHPSSDRRSLDETIMELGLGDTVIVLSATTEELRSQTNIRSLVHSRWNLKQLEAEYNQFLEFYRPLCQGSFLDGIDPQTSFLIRTLLIHDYRRILLRDPDFPEEMLPFGWSGFETQELVARAYKQLAGSSVKYIHSELENAQGTLMPPHANFYKRFGGLEKTS